MLSDNGVNFYLYDNCVGPDDETGYFKQGRHDRLTTGYGILPACIVASLIGRLSIAADT